MEKEIVNIIRSSLRENQIPYDILYFRYTTNYLAVESFKSHPFARVKTTGNIWYIELSCGDIKTGKNFRRFEFTEISEITNYKNEIIIAFRFCDPKYYIRNYARIQSSGLDESLCEFFSLLETSIEGKVFTPSPAETEFFTAYIKNMEAAGLDWHRVNARLLAGNEICVMGGRIKFGKKSSFMTYTEPGNILSIKVKNLSLDKYIEIGRAHV